jgi:hypothetical protein
VGPVSTPAQGGAVETMVHVDLRTVEGAIFLVQVGDAQGAAGLQQVVENAQDMVGVGNVVQRHRGDDQVEALRRRRVGQQVQLQRRHVAHPLRGDFLVHHLEHAARTVR